VDRQAEAIRSDVARSYGEKVSQPAAGGCCGGTPAPKGAIVELGGYADEELATLPPEAVVNSFGCGSPVALAGLRPGDVVLDLGSGAGIDLFLAARRVGPDGRVIGVDMTDEMIAKAKENIRAEGFSNIEVRKGIIEELPVEDSSVDWVISNCVINLSPEKPRVFREISRVLKPGGRMLVSDIMAKDLPAELLAVPALYASCVTGAISEEDYLAGLRDAGLADVEVKDRLVYDVDQLASFAAEGLPTSCGCSPQLSPRAREFVKRLQGRIWSAKVYAKKPL